MHRRIQDAQGSGASQTRGNGNGRPSINVAGAALRDAGLMDGGGASSSGPSRRKGKAARGAGPARIEVDDDGTQSRPNKARDRTNILAARFDRQTKTKSSSSDLSVRGQAFGIRGAAKKKNKGGMANAAQGRGPKGGLPHLAQSNSAPTGSYIPVLRRLLASRWNGAAQMLNLSNLKEDPILREGGVIAPGQPGAHKDMSSAIFKLTSELYPGVVSLSLAQNDFASVAPIQSLSQHLPKLQNLSLENNNIKWTKSINLLNNKNHKFENLRELVLTGNPVQSNAASALNEENYRAEVISKVPTLTLLDSVAVSPQEAAIARLPSGKRKNAQTLGPDTPIRNFPLQINPGFSDESANSIVPTFLQRFFTLFDTSRESPELRSVYASNATFTLMTHVAPGPRAKAAGYQNNSAELPHQRGLNWNTYSKNATSHNIMTLGAGRAGRGCPVGAPSIIASMTKLPATRHPLTDASKFVVDSWVLPNTAIDASVGTKEGTHPQTFQKPDAVLFINVKGVFAEGPSFGMRSFERTFMVAPASPNSPAAKAGWPCTILTEQWTVRPYSGTDGWKVDSLPVGDGVAATSAQSQPPQQQQQQQQIQSQPHPPPGQAQQAPNAGAPGADLSEQQQNMAVQFSNETRLTLPFAIQCLAEHNWDGHAAMTVFTNLKNAGSIPADAFIQ